MRTLLGLAVALAVASSAAAVVLQGPVIENFENYTPGDLIGQAVQPGPPGSVWDPNGTWADIDIGPSAVPAPFGSGQAASSASNITWAWGRFLDDPVDEGIVTWRFDMFITQGHASYGATRVYMGSRAAGGSFVTFSLDPEHGGGLFLSNASPEFELIDAAYGPLLAGGNMGIHGEATLDLDANTLDFDYVGLGDAAGLDGSFHYDYAGFIAIDEWAVHTSVHLTSFDNFRLIPEPATLCLLGLGGLTLLRRRRA